MKKRITFLAGFLLCTFMVFSAAHAVQIGVDEIIWDPDAGLNPLTLSADVQFSDIDGDSFVITLTNTSTYNDTGGFDFPSRVLLTGIGFTLPEGYSIAGGQILEAGTGTDFSERWGFDNDPLDSGPFQQGEATTKDVNTVVSTMESATEPDSAFFFDGGKAKFKGPDYGILSSAYAGMTTYPHIFETALITVDLNTPDDQDVDWATFFNDINIGDVVVSFGSPTAPIPEPATMLLLGSGLIGLAGLRRRFRKP